MTKSYERLIKGSIVTTDGVIEGGWIAVDGDIIAAVGAGSAPDGKVIDDYGDALVFPGFIDGQVHACSYSGYAGIESTSRSAIAGGITTIVDMPYDRPKPVNDIATLAAKVKVVNETAHSDVVLYGTVAPGQGTAQMLPLAKAGVAAFKLSAFESDPVRFPRIAMNEVADILRASVETGLPVGLHNEDQEIVRATIARFKAEGRTSAVDHSESRPIEAELTSTAQFLEIGAVTGAHVHIVHISTPRGYDLVELYREQGVKATAEMCVHYLHFDGEIDMKRLGPHLKVNPPIRAGVIDALWDDLYDGKILFTSSDHSSWPDDNKKTPSIFDAGAGIPGLETLVRSFFTDLDSRGEDTVEIMRQQLCEGPARFFGVYPRKGVLKPGSDADLTVLKRGEGVFEAAKTHDDLHWSPYDQERFTVAVAATYLRGKKVWDGNAITGKPGDGQFVPRTGPSIFASDAA